MIERLSIRQRPSGRPMMHQTWGSLLFMHWPVEVDQLRRHIPSSLSLDTFEGTAWLGMTPFSMWNVRPDAVPSLPVLSSTRELNLRTYVHHEGVPGIWFFSLDASNPVMTLGARLFFSLPYFTSWMSFHSDNHSYRFTSRRLTRKTPVPQFSARWRMGSDLPECEPGTLDFFLIERYCLYVVRRGTLCRCRIFHKPWPLAGVHDLSYHTNLPELAGVSRSDMTALAHAQTSPLHVEIWPLTAVEDGD